MTATLSLQYRSRQYNIDLLIIISKSSMFHLTPNAGGYNITFYSMCWRVVNYSMIWLFDLFRL